MVAKGNSQANCLEFRRMEAWWKAKPAEGAICQRCGRDALGCYWRTQRKVLMAEGQNYGQTWAALLAAAE